MCKIVVKDKSGAASTELSATDVMHQIVYLA